MYSVLPFFLKTMTTSYPHLKIGLHEDSCGVICNKITDREIHFGITPDEVRPERMESTLLYKENFAIVMPKNMKANVKTLGLKALANADWILPSREDGQSYNDQLSRLFQKNGFTPRVVFESPNAATNLRMVSEGLGVTIIGKSAVSGMNLNIKSFELTDIPAKVEMRFVWLKERKEELKEYTEVFLKIFRLGFSGLKEGGRTYL